MDGASRNVVALLPHLRRLGADAALCTLNSKRDGVLARAFENLGIERFDLQASRLLDPWAYGRLVGLLRRRRFDLVHAEDQYANILAAAAWALTRTPFVMTRHVMEEPANGRRQAARARLVFLAARYGARRVIAISEAVRQRFALQAGLPLSRIETIVNGVDLQDFGTLRRDVVRTRLGWPAGARIAIMVAVLRRGKGHEVLLKGLDRIRQAVPDFRLKLVGDGSERPRLDRLAQQFGDAVEFLGERRDVPDLLGASDVLVLPSWNEGLGMVLLEAAAASLPVVATNVGGMPEIVEDGRTGFLVPPGDAAALADRVVGLLNDPNAAASMGRAARRRVEQHFSIEVQARRTLALYRDVLGAA